jgi:acetylornithine/N-succinyldiaminopimelate aminotransferase
MSDPSIIRTSTADLYDSHVMKNYARAALTLVRGRGTQVWDDAGNSYLDFTSGIAVSALGHCHPHWVTAVQRQAGRVFFCNSGAEADEALIKLARLHGVRKSGEEAKCYKIICAKNGFHGRMFGGMSATPQEKIQKGFRPLVPGFSFGELNNLASFAALVDEDTAAIFVETIQGESGINPCTTEFLLGLRRLCDQHNLLLLLDEVQCGIGRTGKFYAFEHAGVRADAIAMAKGLGGGFPIGAIWVGEKAADLFTPGSHGTTFGGTALACAAALAVLDVIEREQLLAHVARASGPWITALGELARDFSAQIVAVRGRGFLVGVQFASDIAPYVTALRERGLLATPSGGNVIRLLPPLNVTTDELARSIDILRGVLAAKR